MIETRYFLRIAAVTALMVLLAACQTPPAPAPVVADPSAATLDQLLASEPQRKAAATTSLADAPARPALVGVCSAPAAGTTGSQCVTMSYYGDASIMLRTLSQRMGDGWTFEVTGPQPRLPIYVQVAATDVALHAFLQDVAVQLAQRADIVISGRRIELRYRPTK